MNYARELPLDKKSSNYASTPAFTSYQSQRGVPVASSVLSLTGNTTVLDVIVVGGQSGNSVILGKWGTSSVTTSNFDWMVNSGEHRQFVVPVSVTGINSVAGANVSNGLYPAVALIVATAQSASVFTAEY